MNYNLNCSAVLPIYALED